MMDVKSTKFTLTSSKFVFVGFLFILIFSVSGYFAHLDPDWHHDGILFKPAVDVASGKSLFRETFTQYGALTTYLQGAAVALFGKHLIVLRIEAALFLALTGALLYIICSQIVQQYAAILPTLVWLFMAHYSISSLLPWSSIFSLFFVILGGWLLISSQQGVTSRFKGYSFCFASGIAFAAGFWARQPYGIVFVLVCLYFVIAIFDRNIPFLTTIRNFLFFAMGFVITHCLMLLWLWVDQSLNDWWIQSILGAQSFAETTSNQESFIEGVLIKLFPKPNTVWAGNGSYIWTFLPVFNLVVLLSITFRLVVVRQQSPSLRALLILCLLGIGTWHQYYPISSIQHVYFGATPMIGVTVCSWFLLFRTIGFGKVFNLLCVGTLIILLFGNDMYYRFNAGINKYPVAAVDFPTLEGMKFSNKFVKELIRYSGEDKQYYKNLADLGATLKKVQILDPNRSLLTITEDAYLPAVFSSKNPHTITVWWRWMHKMYPDHRGAVREFIKIYRPLIEIKTKPWGWEPDWTNSKLPARIDLGFSDYKVLIETDYSDSGRSQILAPPKFYAKFQKAFVHQ